MPLPPPVPGLVIRYAYLWRYEHKSGKQDGLKARPCAIVSAVEKRKNGIVVTVTPITHSAPSNDTHAMEIPAKVKRYLGLDGERSWIIFDEANQFMWPGYDLEPIPGKNGYDYGFLPPRLFEKIKTRILDLIVKRRVGITNRD